MVRAFSYIRFSQKRQQKGESFRRQHEFAVEICAENGWTLDDSLTLHDLGISAFRGNNVSCGALGEFLEAVRIGRVPPGSVLIVESIDRLSRNKVGEALQLFISILNSKIQIATREPRRLYTNNSINDIASLLEPIIYMSRAHEESATKSYRLKDVWEKKKKAAADEKKPLSTMVPFWIRVNDEGQFEIIPERAKIVQKIFDLCINGLGYGRIVQFLMANQEEYPPFCRKKKWGNNSIGIILQSRATIGEYQPHAVSEGKRIKYGPPISGYYPAVISEDRFNEAQACMKARFRKVGRSGKNETNLFTGITFCAHSGLRMCVRANHTGEKLYKYLVSISVLQGESRVESPISILYQPFEDAVLRALSELSPADISPVEHNNAKQRNIEEEVAAASGRLLVLDHRIREAEQKAADPEEESPELYIGLLKKLYQNKAEATSHLERLREASLEHRSASLGEMQSVIQMLEVASNKKEVKSLRTLAKARIRNLVTEIWVYIVRIHRTKRVCHVQMYLRSGRMKYFIFYHPVPKELSPVEDMSQVDFRKLPR